MRLWLAYPLHILGHKIWIFLPGWNRSLIHTWSCEWLKLCRPFATLNLIQRILDMHLYELIIYCLHNMTHTAVRPRAMPKAISPTNNNRWVFLKIECNDWCLFSLFYRQKELWSCSTQRSSLLCLTSSSLSSLLCK